MSVAKDTAQEPKSRSPHGERGLKFNPLVLDYWIASRSPHGERGLKYQTN